MINDDLIKNIPEYAKIIKDLEDKLDHIEKLIDLEWNGLITAKHCIRRIEKVIHPSALKTGENNDNS